MSKEQVYSVVAAIPEGRVASFGGIASAAGLPGRARWVGRVLSQLPPDSAIPWHRVVGHDGKVTCPQTQLAVSRLAKEGIELANNKVNMKRYGWP